MSIGHKNIKHWQNGYSDAKLRKPKSYGPWFSIEKEAYDAGYKAGEHKDEPNKVD